LINLNSNCFSNASRTGYCRTRVSVLHPTAPHRKSSTSITCIPCVRPDRPKHGQTGAKINQGFCRLAEGIAGRAAKGKTRWRAIQLYRRGEFAQERFEFLFVQAPTSAAIEPHRLKMRGSFAYRLIVVLENRRRFHRPRLAKEFQHGSQTSQRACLRQSGTGMPLDSGASCYNHHMVLPLGQLLKHAIVADLHELTKT